MQHTDFNYGADQSAFMRDVQNILVRQPDYGGIGGHDPQDHGGHGLHSQVTIRMGDRNINFRESLGND
jgi:hypothetical protein